MKKGFDIILFESEYSRIWITEIKSGNPGSDDSRTKNKSLLNLAKNDLVERLEDRDATLWHNAINGALVALSEGSAKEAIIEMLEKATNDDESEDSNALAKNVILISVLYNDLKDKITIDDLSAVQKKIESEKTFEMVMAFSIQKETYHRVHKFLRDEAA